MWVIRDTLDKEIVAIVAPRHVDRAVSALPNPSFPQETVLLAEARPPWWKPLKQTRRLVAFGSESGALRAIVEGVTVLSIGTHLTQSDLALDAAELAAVSTRTLITETVPLRFAAPWWWWTWLWDGSTTATYTLERIYGVTPLTNEWLTNQISEHARGVADADVATCTAASLCAYHRVWDGAIREYAEELDHKYADIIAPDVLKRLQACCARDPDPAAVSGMNPTPFDTVFRDVDYYRCARIAHAAPEWLAAVVRLVTDHPPSSFPKPHD